MLVVPDTNVLVSSGLFPGSIPYPAIEFMIDRGELLTSPEIVREFLDVMRRPKFDRYAKLETRLEYVDYVVRSAMLETTDLQLSVCRDPGDDKFLSLAVAGKADAVVTGDADLLALHPFRGVTILTPQQFVEQFSTG